MDIYVIDVGNTKTGIDPEMEAKADMIQYRADLIRGCTDSRVVMKEYFDIMTQLIGEYVDLDVYHYDLDYVRADMPDDEYNKTLKEFALVEYIKERSHDMGELVENIHEMPLLIRFDLENGGSFVTTEEMQDAVTMYGCDERIVLEKVTYIFSKLNKYIFAMNEPALTSFRDRLFEVFPPLIQDYYNPENDVMMDIVYVIMLDIIDLKFIN